MYWIRKYLCKIRMMTRMHISIIPNLEYRSVFNKKFVNWISDKIIRIEWTPNLMH